VQQALIVKIRLAPTPEQERALRSTLVAFADACNHIHTTVPENIRNSARIQQLTYKEVTSVQPPHPFAQLQGAFKEQGQGLVQGPVEGVVSEVLALGHGQGGGIDGALG
jgi:hypothetical protein